MRCHQQEMLKAHSGIDALDPELHEAQEMGDVACRPRCPDSHDLFGPIDAKSRQAERSRTEPARLQHLGQIAEQILHHLCDRLGRADRFEQAALDGWKGDIFARRYRLRHAAERLIEPSDGGQAQPPRERAARDRQKVGDGLESEPLGGAECRPGQPQGGDR